MQGSNIAKRRRFANGVLGVDAAAANLGFRVDWTHPDWLVALYRDSTAPCRCFPSLATAKAWLDGYAARGSVGLASEDEP